MLQVHGGKLCVVVVACVFGGFFRVRIVGAFCERMLQVKVNPFSERSQRFADVDKKMVLALLDSLNLILRPYRSTHFLTL